MKKAIVFLANGFEEMEALGTVDILRRGGIEVNRSGCHRCTQCSGHS